MHEDRAWSVIPGGESEPSGRTPIPSPNCISVDLPTHIPSFSGHTGWGAEATSTSSQLTWFLPSTVTFFGFMIFFPPTVHHTRGTNSWWVAKLQTWRTDKNLKKKQLMVVLLDSLLEQIRDPESSTDSFSHGSTELSVLFLSRFCSSGWTSLIFGGLSVVISSSHHSIERLHSMI